MKPKLLDFSAGVLLGVLVFLLLYGPSTLNPAYDSWIYCGYMEQDIIQRYAGWMFFRHSPWSWPITVAENLSVPYGASIVFTDSIPLMAVFFKLFAPILPETFQYFGLYNLLNFALQGGFAVLLLRHFQLGRLYSVLGSLAFLTMPVFIERVFRHDALASQWILLAALLCYFKARREEKFPAVGFGLLAVFCLTIHTYFLPMVYALLAASLAERIVKTRKWVRPALYLAGCLTLTFVVAYVFGLVTRGGGGGASGFGDYSMNLNALVNPTSFDWYAESESLVWSGILPVLPQFHHQYDGFQYLGLGVLLGLACMAVYGLVRVIKNKAALKWALDFLKSHVFLLAVLFCLGVFSLSNVICWGETILLRVPLPESILQLCAVFRASGRMFWPCAYLLTLMPVLFFGRIGGQKRSVMAVVLLLTVQLLDIGGVLWQKHQYFAQGPPVQQDAFSSEDWRFMAENYNTIQCLNYIGDYNLAAGMIRYNPDVRTNMILTNRGDFPLILESYAPQIEQLRSGVPLEDGVLYICEDAATFDYILEGLHPDARRYAVGQYYLLANPVPGCPVKEVSG